MKPVKNKTTNPIVTILAAFFGIGLILSLLIPISIPIYNRYQAEKRAKREAPFLSLMPQYTAPLTLALYPNPQTPSWSQEITTPKLHGRILVVNLVERTVDELFHELPSELRAKVPEEVGVVVWMNCYTLNTVHYSGPLAASQEQCEVTMIDWPTRLIRYRMELAGETPPDTVQVDKWGRPDDKVWDEYDPMADRQVILEWILARVE